MQTRIFVGNPEKSLSRFWYPNIEGTTIDPRYCDITSHEVNILSTPFKEAIFIHPILKNPEWEVEIDEAAKQSKSANLVLVNKAKKKIGVFNTDADAFAEIFNDMCDDNGGISIFKKVVIIGTGATSRSAAYAIKDWCPFEVIGRDTENHTVEKMTFDHDTLVINTAPANSYEIECHHLISLDQIPSSKNVVKSWINMRGIEFFVKQANIQGYHIHNFFHRD